MKNKEVEVISWFDRPEWFEIGFQNETKKEADFFEAAFKKYCDFPVKRLLEPACGSGRIVTEMAARGYDVTGFDLSEASLEFLRERLKKRRLKATVVNADMTRFQISRQVRFGVLHVQQFPRAHKRSGRPKPLEMRGRCRAIRRAVLLGHAPGPARL